MASNGVRVMLNFQNFDKYPAQSPQKCWYLINKKSTHTVNELQTDVIAKFCHIERNTVDVDFFVGGCLMPKWEDINILRDEDVVMIYSSATIAQYRGNKRKMDSSEQVIDLPGSENQHEEHSEVNRTNAEIDTDNQPNKARRKKLKKKDKKEKKQHKTKRNSCDNGCEPMETAHSYNCSTQGVHLLDGSNAAMVVNTTSVCETSGENVVIVSNKSELTEPYTSTTVVTECPKNIGHIDDQPGLSSDKDEMTADASTLKKRNRRRKRKRPNRSKDKTGATSCVSQGDVATYDYKQNEFISPYDAGIESVHRLYTNQNHHTFDSEKEEIGKPAKTRKLSDDTVSDKTVNEHICVKTPIFHSKSTGKFETNVIDTANEDVTASHDMAVTGIVTRKNSSSYTKKGKPEVAVYDLVSSKVQNHMNGKAQFQLVSGAQVFDRRKLKKMNNFPLSQAVEISKQDVYTNKSIVFENTENDEYANVKETVRDPSEAEPEEAKSSAPKSPPRDYTIYPSLYGAPRLGDKIAYKVLEMSADYSPGLSDYKEAKVLAFDAGSQTLKLELTVCRTGGIRGRFHCELEDEEEILTTEKEYVGLQVDLALASLVEPKLLP